MRIILLALGLNCFVLPGIAQTVVLPSEKAGTSADADAVKDAVTESTVVNKMKDINANGPNGFDILPFDMRPRLVRGTPFLVQGWAMGEVMLEAAAKPTPAVLKFDIYNQQVRALRTKGDSIILAPEKIQSFTIRPTGSDGKPVERRFERLPGALVLQTPVAFAEDLSTGTELRLVKLQRKTIIKGQVDALYGNSNAPVDAYESSTQYYLRWTDGTYVPVKPNKASILAAVTLRQAAAVTAEMQDKTKLRSDAELGNMTQRINDKLAVK